MMPEPVLFSEPDPSPASPFPWRCPRCGRKEVSRTVISYECQRLYQGQPIMVSISDLAVPKCGNCGELVFDYLAEQQIDRAFHEQTRASNNADGARDEPGKSGKGHAGRS
jgi:hypothetical protein